MKLALLLLGVLLGGLLRLFVWLAPSVPSIIEPGCLFCNGPLLTRTYENEAGVFCHLDCARDYKRVTAVREKYEADVAQRFTEAMQSLKEKV